MKYYKVLRILSLGIVLWLVLFSTFNQRILAQSMTLSPTSGQVGATVSVSGGGFTPDAAFEIHFAYDTPYELVISGSVAGDGSIDVSFDVPEVPGGEYDVFVETPSESVSDTFKVAPALKLSKTSAHVGDEVTLSGTGFSVTMPVEVSLDGEIVARLSTDFRGRFDEATFIVPEKSNGKYTLEADDVIYKVSTELKILESIAVTPSSRNVGEIVSVSGTGFASYQTISLTYADVSVATTPESITTDSNGSFDATFAVPAGTSTTKEIVASDGTNRASATFEVLIGLILTPTQGIVGNEVVVSGSMFRPYMSVVIYFDDIEVASTLVSQFGTFKDDFYIPECSNGIHTITASDPVNVMDASLTVLPSITLTPAQGGEDTEVTISGTGFLAEEMITIAFDDSPVGSITSDAKGSFRYLFTVPQRSPSDYSVAASDGINQTGTLFRVNIGINLSETSGSVGTKLTVSGSKFFGAVTIKYDGAVVAKTYSDADGVFSATFDVPPGVHGEHVITVSDTVRELQAIFDVESAPPPQVPGLLLPEYGAEEKPQVSFQWIPGEDPSDVTYTLQIASGKGFNDIVLRKTEIEGPEYTLAKEERLKPTPKEAPYYWRLRAVDHALNEGEWSLPSSFHVKSSLEWIIYLAIGLGILSGGLVAFRLKIKKSTSGRH